MTEETKHITKLIQRSGEAASADEAMKYAQAALNAANALCSLGAVASQNATVGHANKAK